MSNLRYYPEICLKQLRKTTKYIVSLVSFWAET
jgi:hypothetical protein